MTDLHAGDVLKKITLIGYCIALTMVALRSRARAVYVRSREVGASTVEWAIIAAVSVIMATLIGGVIYNVVTSKTDKITTCNNTAPSANATC